jgi:transcriptional regulator with XRE-family HTH domain
MAATNAGIDDLGRRIRERRLAGGRTLAAVAGEVGMSVSHLSAIESGANLPSLPVLARVARALDVSMAELLRTPGKHPMSSGRLEPGGSGAQPVCDPRLRLDVVVLRAQPSEAGQVPVSLGGSVLVHVREGTLTVRIGTAAHELGPGDTLHAARPSDAGWQTPAASGCVAVWVGARP